MSVTLEDYSENDLNYLSSCIANKVAESSFFPSWGYLEMFITNRCNLNCPYCFVGSKNDNSMNEHTAFKAIDYFLERTGDMQEVTILFFGGEPLMEWELIKKIIQYSEEQCVKLNKAISFNMTTNGTLFDKEILAFCADHRLKYLVSLNGLPEDHDKYRKTSDGKGSFSLIADKIRLMKSYQPWQGSRLTIYPDTASTVKAGIEYLYSIGINQFIIGPAHGAPWNTETINAFRNEMFKVKDYYEEMQKKKEPFRMTLFEHGELGEDKCGKYKNIWGCGAGRGRLCVGVNGDLYGCSKLLTANGLDKEGIYKLGNIFEHNCDLKTRAELVAIELDKRKKCVKCDIRDECTGGCPATNYQDTGSIFIPDAIDCEFSHIFVELGE